MPWFKVDDGFASSEPVMRIKRRYRASVIGLWTLSGTWCAKELTDGRVPDHMIEELACTKAQADLLVECGLWSKAPGGYVFVGWEKYQPTREKVEADRKREADRKANYRMSHRDTAGTKDGLPLGHQAESGHPDPTRPDPTHNTSTDVEVEPRKRGTRLNDNFEVTPEMVAWAQEKAPDVNGKRATEMFKHYYQSKSGQAGVRKDWVHAWRLWLLKDQQHAEERKPKPTPEQRARQTIQLATDIDLRGIEQ